MRAAGGGRKHSLKTAEQELFLFFFI